MADTLEKAVIKEICAEGDKTGTIPDTTETGSNALSYAAGFPVKTSIPQRDGGIPPKRTDMNKVLNMLSKNQVFAQNGGVYSFDSSVATAIGGYPNGARLLYNDGNGNKYYIESLKDNNSTAPTEENIYKAPMNFQKVTGVVDTTSNLPTASEDTTSDRYLCLADSKVYLTYIDRSTTPNTYYWHGFAFTIETLDTSTSDFYVVNEGQLVRASSVYDWIAYNTQIKPPIIGITKYALEHLVTRTKDTVYHTTKPTVVIFGALTEQTNKSWFLDVSTDGVNFKTIAGAKFRTSGEIMQSVILDKDLYWQVRTDISSTSDYRIEYASLY